MATCRRPRTNIDAITVFNSYNTEDGSWIPLKISIGSWVLLQTRRRKRKSTNDFIEHFKGQVKGFKVSPGSSCVTEVHIQHSFHHVNLKLKELPLNWPRHRPNYIYPSNRVDWQPIQSVTGIFDCYHAFVGEKLYKGRTHKELAENGIFFFDMIYTEPSSPSAWGRLSALPLPRFDSQDWPLPASHTSESFRVRLQHDIWNALKLSTATKNVRISNFMPIEVFVDFFYDEEVRTTSTMFICKSGKALDFLDKGWDSRQEEGSLCVVDKKSLICRYIIQSQNLLMAFHYTRYHCVQGSMVPLDQDLDSGSENEALRLEIFVAGRLLTVLNATTKTCLEQIRKDLISEELDELPEDFIFYLGNRKVPRRMEKATYCKNAQQLHINCRRAHHKPIL